MVHPPSGLYGLSAFNKWLFNSRLMLCIYSVYLVCALTVPFLGKLAAGLLLLLGVLGLYGLRGRFLQLSWIEKLMLVSFALFSLVSILSFLYWPQTRDARLHLEDYITFVMLIPLYLLLRNLRFSFAWLVVVFALLGVVLGCVAILQFIAMKYYGISILTTGKVFWLRPSGDVNPMRFGAISLVVASFSLNAILIIRGKSLWLSVLVVSAVLLGLVACILAQSRGAWLAIPVLIFGYAVYLHRAEHSRFLMVLIGLGAFVVAGISQVRVVQDRVALLVSDIDSYEKGDSQTSIGARLDMFRVAGALIKERPIFGHGLNSYSPKATEIRRSSPGMSREVGMWANPHNEILQVMVEKGVIGLVSLLLLFVTPCYLFLNALRREHAGEVAYQVEFYALSGLSLLIVYAVVGQSVALFEHDIFNHFFALMVLLFASQIRVIERLGEK